MGRGKVQLKRIEDKIRRQVTFSKRRTGLMKKARELSVLCGVEVGLIIFSAKGRLYEFCSGDSLGNVLERYQIHTEEEVAVSKNSKHHLEFPGNDACTTKSLKMMQSELEAQNIENLDVTELTQLEKQLEAVLRQTRSRKMQLMMETIASLIEKGKKLEEDKDHMEQQIAALMVEKAKHQEEAIPISAADDNGDEVEEMEGEGEGEGEGDADEHIRGARTKHLMLNLF
ncbi:truncated transcription factor CAULIFLOWER A-like [Argentina anserina]|uniref:truncated transcription factor CAULIFLOWER A-like n=1 Tax=Argentina anserina TaxID=57926 RepID=UPI0021762EC9|nr:truncated transcription factor CAULIFLOWER A-like [Potentilla anserina]